ncbi:fructose-1-phosphate kinase PfkB-like protein [Bradyrhizobium sp. AZCC 1588]
MTDIVTITLTPAVDLSTSVDEVVPVAKLRGTA